MSTQIPLSGPASLQCHSNGSYRLSGGATPSQGQLSEANAVVHFVISHPEWRQQLSQPGAAAYLAKCGGAPRVPSSAGETRIIFDFAARKITVEHGFLSTSMNVDPYGVMATVSLNPAVYLGIEVVLTPLACTNPPCEDTRVKLEFSLSPS